MESLKTYSIYNTRSRTTTSQGLTAKAAERYMASNAVGGDVIEPSLEQGTILDLREALAIADAYIRTVLSEHSSSAYVELGAYLDNLRGRKS